MPAKVSKTLVINLQFYCSGISQRQFNFFPSLPDFAPAAGKTYILRVLANPGADGQPATYTRSGKELLEKGLYIELDGGGMHLFEIEEAR